MTTNNNRCFLSTQCCLAPVINDSTWEKFSRMFMRVNLDEYVWVCAFVSVSVLQAGVPPCKWMGGDWQWVRSLCNFHVLQLVSEQPQDVVFKVYYAQSQQPLQWRVFFRFWFVSFLINLQFSGKGPILLLLWCFSGFKVILHVTGCWFYPVWMSKQLCKNTISHFMYFIHCYSQRSILPS